MHLHIGLCGLIAFTGRLISANGNIGMNDRAGIEIAAQPLLEWPQFQLAGTPACTGRGQEITIFLEPEIEVAVGVQPLDRPSEKTLQLTQNIVATGRASSREKED